MFPWNIAKSAEALFSRWAVKRFCQFVLKKKLGQFILGDIDLDQLDVQLREGTIQLSDLALNVDCLNDKFGAAASVIIKEGSIGSLMVKMPWKGEGCLVEIDELEIVLAPCLKNDSPAQNETCSSVQDDKDGLHSELQKLKNELVADAAKSSSGDVHEGVKTIAKMVKRLLTSFHVKVKNLLVAYDPCLENAEKNMGSHATLVLRILETECGTCVSDDANSNGGSNFLGISQLSNFVKFQEAILELLEVDDDDKKESLPCLSGTISGGCFSGHCPTNTTTPIMTGKSGGFSGNLKISIPWKNGSLDIHKVDADVHIDPVELRLQPSTIEWLLLSWETLKNLDKDGEGHMHHKPADSSTLFSTAHATEKPMPNCAGFPVDISSLALQDSATETLLPRSLLISDWMPSSAQKSPKDGFEEELDFGSSVDQFFECFDGMRSFQSALATSGMWNWTSSVFSAITAASSLASGSLHIPPEQQHVETSVKAAFAKISVVLSFHNEDQSHLSDPEGDQVNIHYLGAECKDISLCLQVSPQYKKFEGLVEGIVVADYYSSENSGMDFGLMTYTDNNNSKSHLIRQLQAEVQGALPPFASPAEDPNLDEINDLVAADCPFGTKGGIVKVTLVKTSGVTHCQFSESSSSADGSFTGPTSFSLKVPPFVLWVNFPLINMLLNLSVEMVKSVEMNIKRKEFPPQVSNEKQGSSHVDVRRGSTPCVTSLSSTERLRGDIMMTHVRVILCFPFETGKESKSYPSWDQFIVLDFSPPLALNKGITKKSNPASGANFQENNSSRPTSSLHFHVGDLEIYLVSCASMDEVGIDPCSKHNHKFSSQSILSMTSKTGSVSVISMLWQEGHVTGPWIARRAKLLATLEESRSRYQFVGKDYEFASVSTVKDLEDLHSQTRREIILSSASILHVQLSPVTINLGSSQYRVLHGLLNQVINGLSCMDPDAANSREGSPVYQTLLLVECDTVEILISPELRENIVGSMQSELPGSWYCLRLKIQKFELLSVSNIGGIGDAKFFWLAHGEGKLWGSINGVSEQEFLLISCSNSTMKRGDGKGSNALSSRLAGSDIVYLWEPESFHGFTSINVRCGTIVAVGGRLDWLDAISSFFTLSSPEIEEAGDDSTQKGDVNELCGSSFILNLVDIGLSYEPYLKSLVDGIEVLDSKSYSSSAKEKECGGEQYVACLLAASSLCLTNSTVANSIDNERKIRVQDLGLLLRNVSKLETLGGTYSVEHLRKVGYVRVVREALIEVFIRTNCKNGLLWEVECSKSHIYVETCHDTTSGLIRLAAQLSQLFAPDVEESVVHLQARWNNVQKAQEGNNFLDEIKTFNGDSLPSTSQGHIAIVDTKSEPGSIGLMDEICEDAFHFDSNHTYQFDSSDTDICVSLDESLLGDARILNLETPKTSSVDSSFNGSVPIVGLENSQNSFLEEGYFTEFMEGYCLSELRPLMELSKSRQYMPEIPINRFINVGSGDPEKGNGGWYGDAFKIVENHISEASEQSGVNKFEEGNLPFIDHKRHEDTGNVTGRVLLKNIDIRCRMYAGSDWHDSMGDHEHSSNFHGRDKTALLEFLLSGMEFRYSTFPIGGVCVSKLSLSVEDFHLYDKSRDAPWKLVLGYYHSKNHPRESSSNALKLDLEAVRPDPLIPLEEYRLRIALLPILLHLHQSQLDFLINFFGSKSSSVDESPACHQDSDGSKLLHGLTIANEALLPYFQTFDIGPVLVRVDYSPRHVDLAALRSGKYVELVNLVPWKGVELLLKQVHAVGIYGWGSVCEAIVGEWLEDISQNQIHKILRGLPTIRSLVTVGSGAVKLVSLPVENYRRDRRVLKGMQRGTAAFLRSISLEAVGLGVHLAAGAHDILLQAEYILTSIPPSVPRAGRSKMKTNVRSDQPKDAQEGIQRAYESLSDGLGKSASALVRTPFKKYQSGAGAGSALASAIRGVPAAAIAPASACASAVHYTLLGFRNSLDPERKKESMEKYLGPTQSSDRD